MRIVTIKSTQLNAYTVDPEMLQKSSRPCALVMRLKFRGHRHDFAVPIRSNIHGSVPKDLYFPLPPRKATKMRHRHGIHYAKMFPIKKSSTLHFRADGNPQAMLMKQIIDKNEKRIIMECQNYLMRYESGIIPKYATNIDLLLKTMHS